MVKRHFWEFGSGRKTFPEVREWLGGPLKGPCVVG